VWAEFYEPEELELLEALGFDPAQVQATLASVNFSDEYSFALPDEAVPMPFKYLRLSARIATAGGHSLVGYRTSPCLAIVHEGRTYCVNRGLRASALEDASALSRVLGEGSIFPLKVRYPATGRTEEFSLAAN